MTGISSLAHSFSNHVGIGSNSQVALEEPIIISDTSSSQRTSNFSNLFSGVGTFRTGGTTVIASISFLIKSTFWQKNSSKLLIPKP